MTEEAMRFTLRIKPDLKERLEKCSKNMGVSLNALVVQILWNWVEYRDEPNIKEVSHDSRRQN